MKAEIKIAHVNLETPIILSGEFVQLLIIENPTEFYNTVSDLDAQFEGGEGNYVFSVEDKLIAPSKYGAMVADIFHFDLNDKKLLNLLYKKLEGVAFGESLSVLLFCNHLKLLDAVNVCQVSLSVLLFCNHLKLCFSVVFQANSLSVLLFCNHLKQRGRANTHGNRLSVLLFCNHLKLILK